MADKDYYAVLGVSRSVTEKELKAAYRKLARQLHPDVNPGNAQAEARFKEINGAYEVLSDKEKRKKYDQFGSNWEQAEQMNQQRAHARRGRGRASPAGGFTQGAAGGSGFGGINMEDLFGGMFAGGNGHGQAGHGRRGADTEHRTEITLEEAYTGATRLLQLQGEEACVTCGGTGQVGRAACSACTGLGVKFQQRRLEVKVHPGVKDGMRIRFAGEGQAGLGGAPKGDLYLIVKILPHGRFERKDDDLYGDVDVPLVAALLGGEVKVQTLKGSTIALRIAAGTQNGQTIRLGGLGMTSYQNPTKFGDMYLKVRVQLPTNLTAEQREQLEAFAQSLKS